VNALSLTFFHHSQQKNLSAMLSTRAKIALAAIVHRFVSVSRRLAGYGPNVEVRRSGLRWALDLDEGIDFSIWLLGAFERRTVAAYSKLVRPGMTVLDIGANIGAHTLPLARLVGPNGSLIAIEPTAWASGRLRANVALNPDLANRVSIRQAMLVARAEDVLPGALYASWPLRSGDVHPVLRAQAKSTQGAQALMLDTMLERDAITHVDFVKLDVDGHECAVLRGGLNMFKRDRPAMVLELSPDVLAEAGDSLDELIGLLADCGYRLSAIGTGRPLPMDAAVLRQLIPKNGGINAVATAAGP
jgi:FkbM family methyltransferase